MCTCVSVVSDEIIRSARKDHYCSSCEFVQDHIGKWDIGFFSFTDLRLIVKARQDNWKILKGTSYQKQVNVMDGRIYTFKCRPEMHKLCIKYDLYPEC